MDNKIRPLTQKLLNLYKFRNDAGDLIEWVPGQLEIIDCIVNRISLDNKKRIQVIAATQFGKSLAAAAGILCRLVTESENWAIVAGTKDKARIIMDHLIDLALNNDGVKRELLTDEPVERLRMYRARDRLTFRRHGEVRVYSAETRLVRETSKSLMGFGAPNVVGDESALVPNRLQATVMRMLGGHKDNFMMKIGNPFNRNHFLKTWLSDRYYKIFIDYRRAFQEGRFTPEFIQEMQDEPMFDVLYECKFPPEEAMDESGWMPLLTDSEIDRAMVEGFDFMGTKRLGGDVAGGGRNYTVGVVRSYNLAKKVYKVNQPDSMIVTGNFVNLATAYGLKDEDIFIDKVGVGKGVFDRMRELKGPKVVGVGGAEEPQDKTRFLNVRAEMYWRAREWILKGGKLEKDDDWYQLSRIKYKVADSSGLIKLMSKEEMLRHGIDSPDVADAFVQTFVRKELPPESTQPSFLQTQIPNPDPYAASRPVLQTHNQTINPDPYS